MKRTSVLEAERKMNSHRRPDCHHRALRAGSGYNGTELSVAVGVGGSIMNPYT